MILVLRHRGKIDQQYSEMTGYCCDTLRVEVSFVLSTPLRIEIGRDLAILRVWVNHVQHFEDHQ